MATLIVIQDILPRASSWTPLGSRGGHTMCVLQWLRRLYALGHRVLFVNFVAPQPAERLNAARQYFTRVIETWWHHSWAALIASDSCRSLWGMSIEGMRQIAREADALITIAISGQREPPTLIADIRPRILIDHGALPTFGLRWIPTWNPVVLDFWKHNGPIVRDHFTTIADWGGRATLSLRGRCSVQSGRSF